MKDYKTFLNENLAGHYLHYGKNSLLAIVSKLKAENKTPETIKVYLTSLGVPRDRIYTAINMIFPPDECEPVGESDIFEEEQIDSLISADLEDELDGDEDKEADQDSEEDDEEEKKEDEKSPEEMIDTLKDMVDSTEKLDKIKQILNKEKSK